MKAKFLSETRHWIMCIDDIHRGVARILLKGVLNLVSLTRPLFLLLVGYIVLTSLATLSAFSLET